MTLVEETHVVLDANEVGEPERGDTRGKKFPQMDWMVIGAILTTLGLSLMLFIAYVYAFSGYQATRAQHQLLNEFTTPQGAVPLSGKLPPNGQPTAVLTIPSLGVKVVAVQGTTAEQTAKGPGVLSQGARPGTIGNAVIIGRRVTAGAPFGKLTELRPGQMIKVASGLGVFHYVVERVGTALPGEKDPASPEKTAQLTLMTSSASGPPSASCYVVAKLVSHPGATPVPKQRPVAADLGTTGDPSQVFPSIFLGILFVACIAATIVVYRRLRQHFWTIYIISTPIVLALALFWFEHLYLLLPATY